jgi:hypothetical protein
MARLLVVILIVAVMGWPIFGQATKYDDVIQVTDKIADRMDSFITALHGVKSAAEVAATIDSFAADMKDFKVVMDNLSKKYPELTANKDDPPDELKPSAAKMEALATKMMDAMQGLSAYAKDPAVQAALQKLMQTD